MNQLIGIRTLDSISNVEVLKRDLVLFDKIVLVGLKEWHDVFDSKNDLNSKTFLDKKGLLTLYDFTIYQSYIWMKEASQKLGGIKSVSNDILNEEDKYRNQNIQFLIDEGKVIIDYNEIKSENIDLDAGRNVHSFIESQTDNMKSEPYGIAKLGLMCQDIKTRLLARNTDSDKFTAVSNSKSIYHIDNLTNKKSDVYKIVLEDFPLPSDTVSWEQIFDFKSDSDTYNSIWGLRNWITRISKEDLTKNEIVEEYNYLKHKYEQSIKLHKLKTNNSIFQTAIQVTAELAENLAKLKFKNISEMVFSYKKNKISLLEAELNNEGNQLSYLIKAKDVFKKT